MHISTDLWTWVAALLTLAIFSFIYRDNPLYRFAEHLFVGISAGYGIAVYWHNSVYPNVVAHILEGKYLYVIPFLLGMLYFAIFIPKFRYFIRWPIAFLLGVGSGVAIPASFKARIIDQVGGTVLREPSAYASTGLFLNAVILFLGVLAVLSYFFFSREHKGALRLSSRIGIIFLMIGFGAAFGYTVMARVSLLIGRINFLLTDWLGIIHGGF